MHIKKLILTVFVLVSLGSVAQNDSLAALNDSLSLTEQPQAEVYKDSLGGSSEKNNDLIRIADAFAHTVSSPVRWEKNDWLKFGGAVASTAILTLADKPVNRLINRNTSGFYKELADFGYHNGKPYAAVVVAGGFYVTGWLIKDEWTKETAVVLTSAYLTSGVVQTALKKIVGRARPSEGYGPYEFHPFKNDLGFSSFPSGHSQIAFVTAMVLADRVEQPWLKAVFYSGAAVTMASRMYANAHWFSDVAFGGFLAYICTKKVINRLDHNRYNNPWEQYRKKRISWNVTPTSNGIGVVGTF